MNQEQIYRLAIIITRVKLGNATEEERNELMNWLDEHELNRRTYKRIIRYEAIRERIILENKIEQKADYDNTSRWVIKRLTLHKRQQMIRIGSMVTSAACICGIAIAAWIGVFNPPTAISRETEIQFSTNSKVKLILQSGKQIDLVKGLSEKIDLGKAMITNEGGELIYEAKQNVTSEESLNKIITGVGGEYCLRLSDGSRVWLNAMSELQYPVNFTGKQRIVQLSGEAYFEVTPDPDRPFIIEVAGMQTEVLGTSFNIQAYSNEKTVYTSLLTGKVKVKINPFSKSITLTPGMEAIWEKSTNNIRSQQANVANSIAWRYGKFVFDETDIEVVTRMLSRWYEVEFIFDNDRKGKHTFSGQMSKDKPLESILETIALTGGPKFRQEGNIIHVIEK